MSRQIQRIEGEVPLFDFGPARPGSTTTEYAYRCLLCDSGTAVEPGESCDECSGIAEYRAASRAKAAKAKQAKKKLAAKKAVAKKATATKAAVSGGGA